MVYGLEFLSGGTGTLISYFSLYALNNEKQGRNGLWFWGAGYALITTGTTTAGTHLIGKLFNKEGNCKKAGIGEGIASSFVSFIEYNYHSSGIEYCLLPPIGATTGYNLDRSKFLRQIGIYSFESMGGCAGLGISYLIKGLYLWNGV